MVLDYISMDFIRRQMEFKMTTKISIPAIMLFTILVLGLPLIGVYLSGRSVEPFISFPPLTIYTEHRAFSWLVFLLYLIPSAGVIALVAAVARRKPAGAEVISSRVKRPLPWWGWVALAMLLIFWFFAWTRFVWFEPFQRLTFIPLWFSYIVLVNALCIRQSGTCPLLQESAFFLALFPLSAVFWWFFEYLNQFVQNWFYIGVDYGPPAYIMHATISFCTVLPAVYATTKWISTLTWFRNRFYGLPAMGIVSSKFLNWTVLFLSAAGLLGVGLLPEELFSFLWLAPLLILTALQHLAGRPTLFTAMAVGDWRPAVSAATAALLCGFFWEMWNFFSQAKWIYSIPYVYRFKLFEMPILGYMGYLPFGLLCIEITDIYKDGLRKLKNPS